MITTKGKLRNITSGVLHTSIGDVYRFYNEYLKADGIMTHHIPSAYKALLPIIRHKLPDEWFDSVWIRHGLDEPVEIQDLNEDEIKAFWESFKIHAAELWSKIEDKVIVVKP